MPTLPLHALQRTLRRAAAPVALSLALLGGAAIVAAQDAKPPAAQPEATTAADTQANAPKPDAQISADAKGVLDQVRDAYKNVDAIQMKGTWTAEFDVGGEKGKENAEFTSTFQAPNKFRHESKDDLVFGSTGEKIYVYAPAANRYMTKEAPKARGASSELPEPFGQILREKNPALLLAVTNDEQPLVAEGVTSVQKVADVKIGDKSYTALELKTEGDANVKVLIDPQTHFVRQYSLDMKPALVKRGQEGVNKAELTVDYADVKTGEGAKGADFAWAPPQNARDAAEAAAAADEDPSAALQGKPAPEFTLKGLDDKPVSLKDLKGSVVVLDFWATWCGPCRKGLPHLDKLYQANKGKGLKAYAVDLRETKEEVKQFVEETKLGVPVLMDTDGKVAEQYKVSGIPQTVVIGKDGKVQAVIVGFGGDSDHRLKDALEKAMK